jgi:hypothetical protein
VLPARNTAASVERFFQFSLLGLVATSCFTLNSTGYLDRPALFLLCLGIAVRAARATGYPGFTASPKTIFRAVLAGTAFIPIDFYFLSQDLRSAVIHGACFLTAVKVVTARTRRDYIYTGAISLAGLAAAALLSTQPGFIACLTIYMAFAIATFASAEIRGEVDGEAGNTVPAISARIPWRLALISAAGTVGVIVMTAGIFLIVPRTARTAARFLPISRRLTGFSNHIDLGGLGPISRDTRAVMHIRSNSGQLPPDLKWRGGALSLFDGQRWTEPFRYARPIGAAPGLAVLAGRLQLSRRDGRRILYHVDVRDDDTGTLFLAGIPEFVNIDAPVLYETRESAIRIATRARDTLHYDVSAHFGPPLPIPLTNTEWTRYLRLPPIDPRIAPLAREWSGEGSEHEQATRIEHHLQRDFRYKLDGPARPVRDPLADFLFVRKEGYCEYFASAMAVMLRTIGIPSRVATGFQSGYFNNVSRLNVVRASDAHAWVEAWVDGAWTTFDPTPYSDAPPPDSALSHFDMYLDALDNSWREWVLSYDLTHQILMAARLEDTLRHVRAPHLDWRYLLGALWVLLAVIYAPRFWRNLRARLRRTRRAGAPASEATLLYEKMVRQLARQGIQKPASLTPNEFVATQPQLAEFTALYNRVRFAGELPETARLAELLKGIVSQS